MKKFQTLYQEKHCSLQEAYLHISNDDYVVTGVAGCEPMGFLQELHTIVPRVKHMTLSHWLEIGRYPFLTDDKYRDSFTVEGCFLMGPGREAMKNHRKTYVPGDLHNVAAREIQCHDIDVFVCAVSPMDDMGYFRTSLCSIAEDQYAEVAKKIILEVVPDMPVLFGDNEIHISDVTAVYTSERTIPTIEKATIGETERMIGAHVAPLVPDGSTIQLGIGAIPDAIAQSFLTKSDLGIHTEMITNAVADLIEAGVVTGKCKTLHRGKIIGTFALGSQRLYDLLANNPAVAIMPGAYVNDPKVIAQNDNMVSINTAVTVDFTGQVCSESIGPVQHSGTGGQSDTATGAIHAKNGKSIIALRSTAKNGTISTINPFLPLGSVVTLSRNTVDYIVTEYGVAAMKNRTTKQRAKNLIAIAHPDFRAELTKRAEELYGIL